MTKRDMSTSDHLRVTRNLLSFAADHGAETSALQSTVDILQRLLDAETAQRNADNAAFLEGR